MKTRPHSRPQSKTRLDLIAVMLRGRKSRQKIAECPSPCDSLSPLDGQKSEEVTMPVYPPRSKCLPLSAKSFVDSLSASSREPSQHLQHVVASKVEHNPSWLPGTSSRRSSHRPASIEVQQSNGYTALTTAELKQRICDSRNDTQITITQVPVDKRVPFPPTPTTPFNLATMGNKPSSIAGNSTTDDRTPHSIARSTKPVPRKGSGNLFKRVDSRSPLPRDVTASVMSVMHQESHQRNTSAVYDDDDGVDAGVHEADYSVFDRQQKIDSRYPRTSHMHSLSSTTMTEDKASQPLSASTTVRDFRLLRQGQENVEKQVNDGSDRRRKQSLANTTLPSTFPAPTLPAPSPLPEDSPHKYGLRDKMDTPELPAKAVIVPKARRKSSGLEIFNVSFTLNG